MEYEIIIRPKPVVEFESVEELQRYIDRERQKAEKPTLDDLKALASPFEWREVKPAYQRTKSESRKPTGTSA